MNPPLAFSDALVQLGLLTSQTANFTFTVDEMTQALQTAWNSSFVVTIFWDNSTTFTTGTWQYPIPGTVTTVRELYYQRTTTDNPEPLSPDLYDIIEGNIQFRPAIARWMLTGQTIFVKGAVKLTTDDSLDSANLINFVLYTAAAELVNKLILKMLFVFLRNDTSMVDISRGLQIIESQVLRYKQALLREFESA